MEEKVKPQSIRDQTIAVLDQVQARFPTEALARHIELVKADKIDSWRNASEMLVALSNHSKVRWTSGDGSMHFSQRLYNTNREWLNQLLAQYPTIIWQS